MKLLSAAFALGLAVVGVTAAPVDPDTVAPCILKCYISAAKTAGCADPTDMNCICNTNGGAFLSAAASCIQASPGCDLMGALNMKNDLCAAPPNGGLKIDPPPPGPIDVTAFKADQPCLYNCVLSAAQEVGCGIDPNNYQCACQKKGAFYYAAFPCLLDGKTGGKGCTIDRGLTAYAQVCQAGGGMTNFPPATSAAPARKKRGILPPRCPHLKKACQVAKRTHSNLMFGVQDREELYGDKGTTWECINVLSDLESCGGCLNEDGVDCTAIHGVDEVTCQMGRCVIESCEEGLRLHNGRCI